MHLSFLVREYSPVNFAGRFCPEQTLALELFCCAGNCKTSESVSTRFFLLIDLGTYFPKIWCLKSNKKLRFILLWLLLLIFFFRLREKIGDGIQGYIWWPRRGNSPQSKGSLPIAVPHKMCSWKESLLRPELRRLDPRLFNRYLSTLRPRLLN